MLQSFPSVSWRVENHYTNSFLSICKKEQSKLYKFLPYWINTILYILDQKLIELYMHGYWGGLEGRSVQAESHGEKERKGAFVKMKVSVWLKLIVWRCGSSTSPSPDNLSKSIIIFSQGSIPFNFPFCKVILTLK